MAVPKRKTSKSKRNQRRSHHRLLPMANVIEDKSTGEYRLWHHMDLKYGTYKGKQVITPKQKKDK